MNASFTLPNDAPPLPELAIFVAVADAEGFSAAARRLGVSKAMVSTSITRLEKKLGARLLQRSTRRLALTEAGAQALPHARRALEAGRDAVEAATAARVSPRGTLKVAAPMTFGLLHLAPALGDFAQANPELSVELVLDDRMVDLVAGGFDLALRIGALPDSSLVAHRLGRTVSVVVASPKYLETAPPLRRPEDLEAHRALIYSVSPTGDRWVFARDGREVKVRVHGPLRVNSSLALRDAALQGLGVARVPLFAVADALASGQLVRVLGRWAMPEQAISVVTTAREFQPRKTRAFIDFFRARFGGRPPWERG